jgi:hypothetical protein
MAHYLTRIVLVYVSKVGVFLVFLVFLVFSSFLVFLVHVNNSQLIYSFQKNMSLLEGGATCHSLVNVTSARRHIYAVHLKVADAPSREDASTSWPSSSGLRGRTGTYLTIL